MTKNHRTLKPLSRFPTLTPVPTRYLWPFGLSFVIFWLAPLISGLQLSFFSDTLFGKPEFVGLEHYLKLAKDERFLLALGNTVLFTGVTILTILPLGFALALILQKVAPQKKHLFTFCLLLPGLTPPTVLAFLFLLIFNGRYGMLNTLFVTPFGFETLDWIKDPALIRVSLLLQAIWRWTGFMTLFMLAGLDAIPKSYFAIAKLEGANPFTTITKITLPLMRNVFIFTAIVLFLDAFVLFQGAYVLLGGSGGTGDAGLLLVSYTYFTGFTLGKFGSSAAMSFTLVPFLVGILGLLIFSRSKKASEPGS